MQIVWACPVDDKGQQFERRVHGRTGAESNHYVELPSNTIGDVQGVERGGTGVLLGDGRGHAVSREAIDR